MPSRSGRWKKIRTAEDALAYLAAIDERRRVILEQSWREGSWDAIFDEANRMGVDVSELKRHLSRRWHELYDDTRGKKK